MPSTARRQYAVPCPGCGTAVPIEEDEPETHRRTCAGCGSPLVIVRTDTVFLAAIPRQPTGEAAEARAGAMTDFWTALAQRRW